VILTTGLNTIIIYIVFCTWTVCDLQHLTFDFLSQTSKLRFVV